MQDGYSLGCIIGPHAASAWRRLRRQEAILASNDDAVVALLRAHGPALATGADADEAAIQRSIASSQGPYLLPDDVRPSAPERGHDWLHYLFQIPLPPLPSTHGQSQPFTAEVDDACQRFAAQHPGLVPIAVPLRVTILLVPPAGGKDLDNVAPKVLPAVRMRLMERPGADPLR